MALNNRHCDAEVLAERQLVLPLMVDIGFMFDVEKLLNPQISDEVIKDVAWSDEELIMINFILLEESFEAALNPRSSKSTRSEILAWVDKVTPYREKPKALSFDACCMVCGIDSEEMREQLHNEMKFRGIHPNPKKQLY